MRGERKQKKRQGEKTASKEKEVRKNKGSSSSRRRRKLVSTTTVEVVLEHETRLTLPPELAAVIMSLNKDELVLYQVGGQLGTRTTRMTTRMIRTRSTNPS
jgi:hypothetical protein